MEGGRGPWEPGSRAREPGCRRLHLSDGRRAPRLAPPTPARPRPAPPPRRVLEVGAGGRRPQAGPAQAAAGGAGPGWPADEAPFRGGLGGLWGAPGGPRTPAAAPGAPRDRRPTRLG
eukprot:tig00000449_g951.t1